ncbi:MAG: four helix bundle protein [Bacteroidales bacterium]|nr:four helix bundle protein [Bacteroidales bacterium]
MKTNSILSCDKSNISYNIKIEDLTFNFAKKIVFLRKKLVSSDNKEFIISKQLLRSGTSIGANIAEAEHPQSNADYLNKVSIALKEANETRFWIRLLKECGYITSEEESYLLNDCCTIIKILVSIVNKVSKRLNK